MNETSCLSILSNTDTEKLNPSLDVGSHNVVLSVQVLSRSDPVTQYDTVQKTRIPTPANQRPALKHDEREKKETASGADDSCKVRRAEQCELTDC